MRWTSISAPAAWTSRARAATTLSPMVIGGTKCPSMMSTWIQRAPASSTVSTCSPRRAKSAARIDGATVTASHLAEHARPAVGAGDVCRGRHAHDRRVLAAVRAHGHELEAGQAVHAAIAPGEVGGPQPRLAALGAGGAGAPVGHRTRLPHHPDGR